MQEKSVTVIVSSVDDDKLRDCLMRYDLTFKIVRCDPHKKCFLIKVETSYTLYSLSSRKISDIIKKEC